VRGPRPRGARPCPVHLERGDDPRVVEQPQHVRVLQQLVRRLHGAQRDGVAQQPQGVRVRQRGDGVRRPQHRGAVRVRQEVHRAGGSCRTSAPTEIGRARMTHLQGDCSYRPCPRGGGGGGGGDSTSVSACYQLSITPLPGLSWTALPWPPSYPKLAPQLGHSAPSPPRGCAKQPPRLGRSAPSSPSGCPKLGPGRYCSPCHRMTFNSKHDVASTCTQCGG